MKDKPLITVFTPTYNRIHVLRRTYDSLCNQTDKNFLWMIIDDGSGDETKAEVSKWIKENKIRIEYHYKKNGGMHTAHNMAYSLIETELNVCMDSDDYMPEKAIEAISDFWMENKAPGIAGIAALNFNENNKLIGTILPEQIKSATLGELYWKYKIKGDKKLVYRTDLMKGISPYPEFDNEKLVPLTYKYKMLDKKYELLIMNKILCYVEYQDDGYSSTILDQYFQSPRGFSEYRKFVMENSPYIMERIRATVHYIAKSIILKNSKFIKESPKKTLTFFAIPVGVVLYIYLIIKTKKFFKNGKS